MAACGTAQHEVGVAAVPTATAAPSPTDGVLVPRLVGLDSSVVDKMASAAGVVAMIESHADAGGTAGTVVSVDPSEGTTVPFGSVVTVVVGAGPATLDELVAANRRTFVGVGVHTDGTLLLALGPDADDGDPAVVAATALLAGRPYRVVRCAVSWQRLAEVHLELTQRSSLPGADARPIALGIDPGACAVRLSGAFTDAEMTAIRERYGDEILVEQGVVGRSPLLP